MCLSIYDEKSMYVMVKSGKIILKTLKRKAYDQCKIDFLYVVYPVLCLRKRKIEELH